MVCIADLFAFVDLHTSRWSLRRQAMMSHLELGGIWSVPRYYDKAGFPIPAVDGVEPTLVWAQMMEDLDYKRVAYDELPDGSYLSTVWLGLDHSHGLGPPLIFETMRFPNDDTFAQMEFPDIFGESDETVECLRYGSEEEALAAHHEIVRRLRIREGH